MSGGGTAAAPWSYGALAPFSARLDIDWHHDAWADSYDTEAKLVALGWTVVNIAATSCAPDTTAPKDEDQLAVRQQICQACGGTFPNNCGGGRDCGNKILRFADSCQYDLLADTNGGIGAIPALDLNYSNYAIVGGGMRSTYIAINNEPATADVAPGVFATNSPAWGAGGGADPAGRQSYPWTSGTAKGATTLRLASCAGLSPGDMVEARANDEDGSLIRFATRVVSVGAGCDLVIADPLPMQFTTPLEVQRWNSTGNSVRTRNNFFLNIHIGFALIPDGTSSSEISSPNYGAVLFRLHGVEQLLFDHVWLGPYGQQAIDVMSVYRPVIRHGIGGPGQTSKRRGTRTGFVNGNAGGSPMTMYDQIFKAGAIRTIGLGTQSSAFGFFGFNYWEDQTTTVPGESGNYCDAITNPQGFPNSLYPGGERAIFIAHDDQPPFTGNFPAFLVENNDIECHAYNEARTIGQRYGTLFRNRGRRHKWAATPNQLFSSSFFTPVQRYSNFIANRFIGFGLGSQFTNALGRWNVGSAAMVTPNAAGADWDSTNQLTSGANSECSQLTLPTSLAFRTSVAPSWWCRESGTWNATTMGACEGASPQKLPAQIRSEGGTCTPP